MGFEKVVETEIFGVTSQASDVRLPIGYSSGGTHTSKANPLKGSLMWDRAMYVLQNVSVTGAATGGSFTVTIETDAVSGYTGLPIAQATLGPNSATTVVMDNLHQSAASARPTHLMIDETAGAWAVTLTCDVIAKQYRGFLGSPAAATSERILQGTMVNGSSISGGYFTDGKGFDSGTFNVGTSATNVGMHRMRLWDNALFWVVAGESVSGSHDVDIIAEVGGVTTSIASTGTGGALNVAGEKLALANNFYGQCPNPTAIIWTEVTGGGVSDARVVVMAKGGRGSLAKR